MSTASQTSTLADTSTQRQQLRSLIRKRRQQLSAEAQQQAATALTAEVMACDMLNSSQHIALYLANDAEIDTYPLIQALWQQGKSVYLPVLHPFVAGYLLFVRYDKDTLLYPNKFGIPEPLPACHKLMPVQQLDIIFTPLVAFDAAGNRLGMGGGFYDRTLSQLPQGSHCQVTGLAHNCQQVDAVPGEAWDIPLKQIITPGKYFDFR
ncbi:5-formyltetrahydrofolate cyclo-ligase [Rheinheimera sp. YQF-2]|uniref:5-formyltetrahydrofolate cyclo-ligase n=1 Tax=Rheinheimera lutimaris TaxID=2740584 RepID=A0A7Y5EGF5_9GAMM|nr:5-formyltetrahydrofolate cyclo-ligase [Rheinheimera lutimaris]NRQ41340.1 5-formyltetrahydrofolate cyclo-ligase [Rheinheimera lutimaris]